MRALRQPVYAEPSERRGDGGGDRQAGRRTAREGKTRSPLWRSLGHRNYKLFFGGQLVSLIGTWMQTVAESWLVYRLTGSSLLLGAIGFATQAPVLVLGPFGGAIADRYPRRRILIATQSSAMVLAFAYAALTLLGVIRVWEIFVLAVLLGSVNAFDAPARQALVVEMVGREDLVNAIALNSSMFNGARVVGPALAGLLVGAIGEGWCFFVNGVSFTAVLASLLAMRLPRTVRAPHEERASARIAAGFRFVAHARAVRAILLLLGLMSLGAMPYIVLMPIFADRILRGGPSGLGVLMGASGVGALIGAVALASRQGVTGLGRWVAIAAACAGASLIGFGLSRSFWGSVAVLVPAGMFMMIQMAGTNTLVQSMVPDALRGRVMAVYTMMFLGMAPFGALLAGALANHIGAPMTVVLGGAVCLLGGLVFALRLPALRPAARAMLAARQAEQQAR